MKLVSNRFFLEQMALDKKERITLYIVLYDYLRLLYFFGVVAVCLFIFAGDRIGDICCQSEEEVWNVFVESVRRDRRNYFFLTLVYQLISQESL